jgi:hypothetical protein
VNLVILIENIVFIYKNSGPKGIRGEIGVAGNPGFSPNQRRGKPGIMGDVGEPGLSGLAGPDGLDGENAFHYLKGDPGIKGK